MKTHDELLKENRVIYQMIAEHCNEDRTANAYWSDWRRCTDQKMAGDVLRKILTGMMIAENECTEVNAAETIDRLVAERLEKQGKAKKYEAYIPENECGIEEGFYDINGIVGLLRKHKDKPETIEFIAEMIEE